MSLLLALLCGCAATAPDATTDPTPTLADLERARPPAVTRLSPTTHAPAWDDERPARDWPPLRATLESRGGGQLVPVTHELWRGRQRLTKLWGDSQPALTYVRNPLAPTRVAGLRPSPERGVLVAYDHSTLLSLGHAGDWDTLACCDVDPRALARMVPADQPPERAFGLEFRWWVAPDEAGGGTDGAASGRAGGGTGGGTGSGTDGAAVPEGDGATRESTGGSGHDGTGRDAGDATAGSELPRLLRLAWNADLGLPLLAIVRLPDGSLQRQELVALDPAPDPAEPPDPLTEWPDLRLIDLADLLEESHG